MKVKVRIAVCIDAKGDWNACGWCKDGQQGNPKDTMEIASEEVNDGERRYWIEAELEAPEIVTVRGEVRE